MPQSEFSIHETVHLSIAQLADATNATFADYFTPVSHTPMGFAMFCRSHSVDVSQSVLLQHRDGRLAGLSMLATRGARGWCGGFGIVPEFRGQGLSAMLVNALIGRACSLSLNTLQLEVLTQNAKAIRTYKRAGFQTRRDLVILSGDIKRTDLGIDPGLEVQPAGTPEQTWIAGLALPRPIPCWQREIASLLCMSEIHGLIARRGTQITGVLLYRPSLPPGPVALMHLVFTDEAAAHALLAYTLPDAQTTPIFILNEPEGSPLHTLLLSLGLREINRQHEMSAEL